MTITYAILNAEGVCVNRILWNGVSDWQPPDGCTAVADPESLHLIYIEPQPDPTKAVGVPWGNVVS